jgi:hypothetical protein
MLQHDSSHMNAVRVRAHMRRRLASAGTGCSREALKSQHMQQG